MRARAAELLSQSALALDYDDISLVPRRPSTLRHRVDATPSLTLGPAKLTMPLVASPMPDVSGLAMCRALAARGALGILHRFQPISEQVRQLRDAGDIAIGAAVGVSDDVEERATRLVEAGCRILCI